MPARSPYYDPKYQAEVDHIEDMVEFHPEVLNALSEQERAIASEYYFAGRDIDVDDIFAYRAGLLAKKPNIEEEAVPVYHKLMRALNSR